MGRLSIPVVALGQCHPLDAVPHSPATRLPAGSTARLRRKPASGRRALAPRVG